MNKETIFFGKEEKMLDIGGITMSFAKRFLAATMVLLMVVGIVAASVGMAGNQAQAASAKTGTGLSEHAIKAYNEGWQYHYGSYGEFVNGTRATDCGGLIKSYLWWTSDSQNPRAGAISVAGGAGAMLNSATASGTIDYSDPSSLPRVHGLILYQPGHVGVYVGNNMAVDNRDYGLNIKYEKVFGRAKNKWTTWFKLPQISYPTTGWATFQGQKFYYENGQYIINTTRTIDGITYSFGSDGVAKQTGGTPTVSSSNTATASQKKTEVAGTVAKKQAAGHTASVDAAQTEDAVKKAAEERAAKAIEEKMAAVAQEKQKTEAADTRNENAPSESPSAEPVAASQSQLSESEEEALNHLTTLGLAANDGNTESSVNSVPESQPDDLVFADGVIPKASAKATVFDAPQQVKGMNSILAMLIVLAATGITAAIVIPRRLHLVRKHGRVSKKRVFRGFRNKK